MALTTLTNTFHHDTYPAISSTNPSLSQAGKTVLITGGGSGIGFEIVRSFAKAKASRIIIVGRRITVLEDAVAKLCGEFPNTEFIPRQGDISDEASAASVWDHLNTHDILVHVLVLNAMHLYPMGPDTLRMERKDLMEAFNTNVGGNFTMTAKFVNQTLRPVGEKLNLVNISTAGIQMNPAPNQNPYVTSKAAFTALLGRIADEHPVEDVQIISFHPGVLYSETVAKHIDRDVFDWDEMALPADFAVWSASPEAAWLHGRFVWAHWDVDELKADKEITKRLEQETGFLKVAVQGLTEISETSFLKKKK
ncbi:MAG: short-chain dehydrogenase/reductase [Lentinula lateritia]|uniref:Short-chain dehydrogenase/reductase n=1 Tax=Lentinula lateritia TaxID=40482 RepID=A0ABQ8V3Q1_9AGAR|nr:MAG: short-chain dehydrogenase/reductase [Lentinula lateritia]KAJ4472635.1 short-chain dehydrogenase/reductase [Lentinula lateritia]